MNRYLFPIVVLFLISIVSTTNLEAGNVNRVLIDSSGQKQVNCKSVTDTRKKSKQDYGKYANCVISNNYNVFFSIYKRHLRKTPNDKGNISLKIVVNESGKISNIEIENTNIQSSKLIDKIRARMKLIKLLEPLENNTSFIYEFKFDSEV